MSGNVTRHNAIVWDSQIPENDMHASFSLAQLLVKDTPKCYNRMSNHSLNESASNQQWPSNKTVHHPIFLRLLADFFPITFPIKELSPEAFLKIGLHIRQSYLQWTTIIGAL